MKDLYLSCVHLGNPLFKSEDKIKHLLEGGYSNVFLLGDIFDEWEMSFKDIIEKYRSIVDKINELSESKQVVIIKGNHDPSLEEMEKVFPKAIICYEFVTVNKGGRVVLIHGDQFDSSILQYYWVSKILYYLFVWPVTHILRINIRDWFKVLLHSIAAKREDKQYDTLVGMIENAAVEKLKMVAMGHTHIPKIIKTDDSLYINPGDWIHNRSFIVYDHEEDVYTLIRT
jgi:UDP-2,3-diacylglucosamine pyrophosphatase LpxH